MGVAATSEAATRPVCDNRSVGILVAGPAGRHLLLERVKPPVGKAPAAGHVDEHGSTVDTARAETNEELGLTVVRLELLAGGWLPNRCRRDVLPGCDVGHLWTIYRADVTGDIAPGADEARNVAWHTRGQVQSLAHRTVDYARGRIGAEEFARAPGLEPAWVYWYARLGLIRITGEDLKHVSALYA